MGGGGGGWMGGGGKGRGEEEEEEVAECVLEALPLHTFVAEVFFYGSRWKIPGCIGLTDL